MKLFTFKEWAASEGYPDHPTSQTYLAEKAWNFCLGLFMKPHTVPEGWKLVPVEPTEEQWQIGVTTLANCILNKCDINLVMVYEAMINAAPEYKPNDE